MADRLERQRVKLAADLASALASYKLACDDLKTARLLAAKHPQNAKYQREYERQQRTAEGLLRRVDKLEDDVAKNAEDIRKGKKSHG